MRKELEEQRNDLLNELEAIVEKAKAETRTFNDEEVAKADEIKNEIRKIDETAKAEEEIRKLEKIEEPKEEKRMANLVEKLMAGQNIDLSKEERAVTAGVSNSGNVAAGGQLVGKTFADSIVQKLVYVSPLYGQANKIITSQPHQIPIQASKIGKFVKTAELADYVAQNASFGTKTLNAVKYTNMFVVSKELLEDSMYDIEGELISQTIEALATTLDELIVKGSSADGIEGLESFATANGAKEAVCSKVKTITTDDIVELFYSLPIQYRNNAVWIFNDNTAKVLSKLVDANKQPLLYANFSATPVGPQFTMLGRPVIINNNVADLSSETASKAMFFVDLSRALTVGVRKGFEMQRSTEFGFLNDSVAVKSSIRLDVKTVVEEACAYLKTKIS